MKAAVLREAPGELAICDVRHGDPGPREVLVRTVAAGLCHSDLHFMEALYPHPLPAVLGHESAGVVEAVGDQVSYVAPGDHVITCLSVYCGNCENCLSGRPSIRDDKMATNRPTGAPPRLATAAGDEPLNQFLYLSSFAERMLVHEHAVVKIRPEMPLDRAALIGCGVTTGIGAVLNTARVEAGTTVAVVGCGGNRPQLHPGRPPGRRRPHLRGRSQPHEVGAGPHLRGHRRGRRLRHRRRGGGA